MNLLTLKRHGRRTRQSTRNEYLAKYLIDISKYFLTSVLIATFINDIGKSRWLIYLIGGVVAIGLLLTGLLIMDPKSRR